MMKELFHMLEAAIIEDQLFGLNYATFFAYHLDERYSTNGSKSGGSGR
jgi:hypothetical protein